MAESTSDWQEGSLDLAYRMGEVTLFEKHFSGLILKRHFLELTTDLDNPPPPFDRLGQGVDVLVMRSHPIREPHPVLTWSPQRLRYVAAQYTRQYVPLDGTYEEYLAKFSSKTRSTLRRKVRRLLEHADGCRMKEYKRPEDMAEFHGYARAVSALTYQEKLFDAGLPAEERFVRELVDRAKRGAVRGYVLFLKDEPIAYLCCLASGGVLLYSYLGYDPRHAAESPGTVLQMLAFEALYREQAFRVFDFTEGQGEHKKLFAADAVPCADVYYFPNSTSALLWVLLHRAFDRFSSGAGRLLAAVGLKSAVKRLIRRV